MANPVNPNQTPLMFSQFPAAETFGPTSKIVGYDTNYPGVNFQYSYDQITQTGPAISQLQYLVTTSGQTFDFSNTHQTAIAVSQYSHVGASYYDGNSQGSGTPNAYSAIRGPYTDIKEVLPESLQDLTKIVFFPNNANTGACTLKFTTQAGDTNYPMKMPVSNNDIPAGLIQGAVDTHAIGYEFTFSAAYSAWYLTNFPQQQADWNQTNAASPAYIKNKPNVLGFLTYMGTWNASANTPTLANPPDASTKGFYYVVNVAGTQFSISWEVGDWIVSNGSAWEKVDNSDSVTSVFGRQGAVVATSGDYNASQITFAPSGSITANNTQSAIEQLDTTKQPIISVLDIAHGGTNSTNALNNNRVMVSSGGSIVEGSMISAGRAIVSDSNGLPSQSNTTSAQIGYLSNVTSDIQAQLDSKAPLNIYAGSARYNGATDTLLYCRGSISGITKIQQGIYEVNLTGLPDNHYAPVFVNGVGTSLGINDNALLYRIDYPYLTSTSFRYAVVNLADNTFVDADTVSIVIS